MITLGEGKETRRRREKNSQKHKENDSEEQVKSIGKRKERWKERNEVNRRRTKDEI